MTLLVRTTAVRIPAPRVTAGQGAGQQIGWQGETLEQLKLALPKARSLRAAWLFWFFLHIVVIMLQVTEKIQVIYKRENRGQFLYRLQLEGRSLSIRLESRKVVPVFRDSWRDAGPIVTLLPQHEFLALDKAMAEMLVYPPLCL
jgi:hypothetical protein